MTNVDTLQAGTPVSLLGFYGNEPFSAIGTVYSYEPFVVEISGEVADWANVGNHLKVLYQNAGNFETADAAIEVVSKFGGRLRIQLSEVEWTKRDRRSFERYDAKLYVKCRAVSETVDGATFIDFAATTNDLSLGGAWINSDSPVALGTILNCELSTGPKESFKVLAVVAWVDPNGKGFGIEFVDFVGESKMVLNSFIWTLAA